MSSISNAFNNYYTTNNNYFGALPTSAGLSASNSYSVLNPNMLNPGMAAGSSGDLSALLGNPFSNQMITNNSYSMGSGFGVSPYNINVTQNFPTPFNPGFGMPGGFGMQPPMMMAPPMMYPPMPPMMPSYPPMGYGQGGYGSDGGLMDRMMNLMQSLLTRVSDLFTGSGTSGSTFPDGSAVPETIAPIQQSLLVGYVANNPNLSATQKTQLRRLVSDPQAFAKKIQSLHENHIISDADRYSLQTLLQNNYTQVHRSSLSTEDRQSVNEYLDYLDSHTDLPSNLLTTLRSTLVSDPQVFMTMMHGLYKTNALGQDGETAFNNLQDIFQTTAPTS